MEEISGILNNKKNLDVKLEIYFSLRTDKRHIFYYHPLFGTVCTSHLPPFTGITSSNEFNPHHETCIANFYVKKKQA